MASPQKVFKDGPQPLGWPGTGKIIHDLLESQAFLPFSIALSPFALTPPFLISRSPLSLFFSSWSRHTFPSTAGLVSLAFPPSPVGLMSSTLGPLSVSCSPGARIHPRATHALPGLPPLLCAQREAERWEDQWVGGWTWRRGPAPRARKKVCVAMTWHRRRAGREAGPAEREARRADRWGCSAPARPRAPRRLPAEAQAGRRRRRAAWRACWRTRCAPCSTSRSSRPSCRTSRASSTPSASASTSWSDGWTS